MAGAIPAGSHRLVMPAWLRRWRNGWLASPAFRRWALRLPLTRGVARRHASELFALTTGFVHSQVLLACVELDVFERLDDGGVPLDTLADEWDIPPQRARALVDAAIGLGLLEGDAAGRVMLGVHGAALRGDPGVRALIRHHRDFYADLADPVSLLRRADTSTRLARWWPYAGGAGDDAGADAYSALMGGSQGMIAEQVLSAYRFGRHRRVLDIGGGDGRFIECLAAHEPALEFGLFDLPAVIDIARERLGERATGRRLQLHPGDFFRDPIPRGYDAITLVRIVHDHDDEPVARLLSAIRRALVPGGRVIIAEPMIDRRRRPDRVASYFSLYLLAMGSGRPRDRATLAELLEKAGFDDVRDHPTRLPLLTSVMSARRGSEKA